MRLCSPSPPHRQQRVPLSRWDVALTTHGRNVDAYFDASMSIATHVSRLVSSCFYQLRPVRAIRRSIPTSTAVKLINSFVVSRIDYCHSLLAGCCRMDRVQSILNFTALLVYCGAKYDHFTPILRDKLHWLRVPERIQVMTTRVQGSPWISALLYVELLYNNPTVLPPLKPTLSHQEL